MSDDSVGRVGGNPWGLGDSTSPMFDGRVSGLVDPTGTRLRNLRRLGTKIPTAKQLDSLVQDGRIVLPRRYFRGTFLDLEV